MNTYLTSNEAATTARRSARRRTLGPDAKCALCDETNPDSLTRVSRTLLQEHHIAGRANDGEVTVVLCLNHHARVTAKQLDTGVDFGEPTSILDRAVSIVRSIAALLVVTAEMLVELAALLVEFCRALCEKYPDWKAMPEATV